MTHSTGHDIVTATYNFIGAVTGTIVSFSVQALPVVQMLAAIVAIVTGVYAIRYYIKAARAK